MWRQLRNPHCNHTIPDKSFYAASSVLPPSLQSSASSLSSTYTVATFITIFSRFLKRIGTTKLKLLDHKKGAAE
ncbi:hypothetical protein C1H46_013246 [Malus baccata]|uniref:Uncharacterized protein n=1 Tax=Malus baccata TaxID=106549 RepID=A0A540MQR7_MALBA|nr:hypothetical protein C1H46_013246 [Malus baccata]